MSLTVETGAVVAGAESYISVADATAYHLARGNTPWSTLTTSQMEEALRRATDYMVQNYRQRWKGDRKSLTQMLDWPRLDVYLDEVGLEDYVAVANDSVPEEVRRACAELSLRAAAGELADDLERGVLSETVGPISVTYDSTDQQGKRYRSIDMMLSPYIEGSSMNVRIGRS